ncbi:sex hormone-binding globulin [Ascaphus truei]|uniref:sex hormone-binding globulin n=1 Tax=Ascaphus truei TaxID=8439 RepID=UPI003F59E683
MGFLSRTALPFILLFLYEDFIASSPLEQDQPIPKQASCLAVNPVRSADSLYLGKGDAQNILRMEFQLSDLRSNLSSFDFRTFDPEGIIFYGDIGEDNWFVLGVRQRRLEVQMSNGHGQMVLSKWGPDVSDGTWRKVSVDSSVNTIEVTVDGELVVKLTHHVSTQLGAQTYATLNIILGDLPAGSRVHLFRPLQPAMDGCMRNWAWVKKDTRALEVAMETDVHRRCFQQEEPGSYFPGHGHAMFIPSLFHTVDDTWRLSVRVSFRPMEDGGVLLAVNGPDNVTAFMIALDRQKQALVVTLLGKGIGSVPFAAADFCLGRWQSVDVLVLNNKIEMSAAGTQSAWDINPGDVKNLEDVWLEPTAHISVGGLPDHPSGSYFSGCLRITLQGISVDLDAAMYKHHHVRSHSCPQGI